MSTTYSLVCDDCKENIWVGQSKYLYCYQYIADFFNNHMGHNLRYLVDTEDMGKTEDYHECSTPYEDELTYKEKFNIAFQCGITSFLLGEDCLERLNLDLSIKDNNAKDEFEFWYYSTFIKAFLCAKVAKKNIEESR